MPMSNAGEIQRFIPNYIHFSEQERWQELAVEIFDVLVHQELSSYHTSLLSCTLAGIYSYQDKIEEALQMAHSSYKIARDLNNQNLLLNSATKLGDLYKEKGRYEIAKPYFVEARHLATRSEDYNEITISYIECLLGEENFDEGRIEAERLVVPKGTEHENLLLNVKIAIYLSASEFTKAYQTVKDAYNNRINRKKAEIIANCQRLFAKIKEEQRESTTVLMDSLEQAGYKGGWNAVIRDGTRALKNYMLTPEQQVWMVEIVAKAHIKLGNYGEALGLVEKNLALARFVDDKGLLSHLLCFAGLSALELGQYCRHYADEAYELARFSEVPEEIKISCYYLYGKAYGSHPVDLEKAEEGYRQAFALNPKRKQYNELCLYYVRFLLTNYGAERARQWVGQLNIDYDSLGGIKLLLEVCSIYYQMGELEEALSMARHGLAKATEHGYDKQVVKFDSLVRNLEENLGIITPGEVLDSPNSSPVTVRESVER